MNKTLGLALINGLSLIALSAEAASSRGSIQRTASSEERRNFSFTELGNEYADFKNKLNKKYGFNYSIDVSYMPQRGAPSGKKTAYQTLIYPSFTWTNFNNKYGMGTLNFAYNIARYGGASASKIGSNIGVVTGINDYTSPSNSFDELYYTYQLPGRLIG